MAASSTTVPKFFPDTRQWDWRALFHLFRGISRLDIRAQLSEVRCPVLVVAGTHDPVIPAGQPKLLQASIRHVEVAWLNGGATCRSPKRRRLTQPPSGTFALLMRYFCLEI